MRLPKTLSIGLNVIFWLGLIWLVYTITKFEELFRLAGSVSLSAWIISVGCYLAICSLDAIRSRLNCINLGVKIDLRQLLFIHFRTPIINVAVPLGFVTESLFKGYCLTERIRSANLSAAVVIIDKYVGAIAVFIVLGAALLSSEQRPLSHDIQYIGYMPLLVGFLMIVPLTRLGNVAAKHLARFVSDRPGKLREKVSALLDHIIRNPFKQDKIILMIGTGVVNTILQSLPLYMLTSELNIHLSFADILWINIGSMTIGSLLPVISSLAVVVNGLILNQLAAGSGTQIVAYSLMPQLFGLVYVMVAGIISIFLAQPTTKDPREA